MWTSWQSAGSIQRLELGQIDFTDYSGQLDQTQNIISIAPARATSTSTGALTRQETSSLLFRDWGFTGIESVIGLELRIRSPRLARIQDRTIQLWQTEALGRNLASLVSEDDQVYGGDLAVWGIQEPLLWNTDQWGVIIDLQPHVSYPSSNSVLIQRVELRLRVE